MSIRKRTRGLSNFTKDSLKSGETETVDFKKIPGGVNADDLVAFANSSGGQLLIGVIESSRNGAQIGEVIGCDVSDGAILQILNRASSCIPPVSVDVFIENLSNKPILRIVVPVSQTKPHCTPKGIYCRRDGTRNRALQPGEILGIFLEIEARSFATKFEAAADRIAKDLVDLEESLEASIGRMADQLGWADFQLGDTESTVDSILGIANRINTGVTDTNSRLRSLFQQDSRDDPVKKRETEKLIEQLIGEFNERPEIRQAIIKGQELSFSPQGRVAQELTEEELREAFRHAAESVRREANLKRYSREIKRPADVSKEEMDRFIALVSRGGEVADGLQDRIAHAKALGFVKFDEHPVGVAAIKRPLKSYRMKVFEKSKSSLEQSDFSFELGWIYLKENHRQKGQITPLLEEMLSDYANKAIFATTRSSNLVMMELLKQLGFKMSGTPYRSIQHPDESLSLFVKSV